MSPQIKSYLLIVLTLCLTACGQDSEEKAQSAVVSAISHLTAGDCQKAIDALASAEYQHSDARFIKTYASAYACRAGYSTPRFFSEDLSRLADPSPLGGNARFSTSNSMTEPRHESFEDLQIAINALLYAGGLANFRDPTPVRRSAHFSARDLDEIHSQLLYLLMAQLGKYIYYYANTVDGVKGAGTGASRCLLNYDGTITLTPPHPLPPTNIENYLGMGVTGACEWGESGHSHLGPVGNINVERACQGVILLNNTMEVLPLVLISVTGGELTELENLIPFLETARNALMGASPTAQENVGTVLSQHLCEDRNAADTSDLQRYFAIMYEALVE